MGQGEPGIVSWVLTCLLHTGSCRGLVQRLGAYLFLLFPGLHACRKTVLGESSLLPASVFALCFSLLVLGDIFLNTQYFLQFFLPLLLVPSAKAFPDGTTGACI